MDEPGDGWHHIRLSDFGLTFAYPPRTPSDQAVEFDDVRLHAQSTDGEEVYFELSRHLDVTARARYERERDFVSSRYGADVTPLTPTTLTSLAAHEFGVSWGETQRRFVLVERGRWLYRFVYDPRSPLNVAVLQSIRIDRSDELPERAAKL